MNEGSGELRVPQGTFLLTMLCSQDKIEVKIREGEKSNELYL